MVVVIRITFQITVVSDAVALFRLGYSLMRKKQVSLSIEHKVKSWALVSRHLRYVQYNLYIASADTATTSVLDPDPVGPVSFLVDPDPEAFTE
jgi:hypothetical protein